MIQKFRNGVKIRLGDSKSFLELPSKLLQNLYPGWQYSCYRDDLWLLRHLLMKARNTGACPVYGINISTKYYNEPVIQLKFGLNSFLLFNNLEYAVWFHTCKGKPIQVLELAYKRDGRSFFIGHINKRYAVQATSKYDSELGVQWTGIRNLWAWPGASRTLMEIYAPKEEVNYVIK